MTRKTLPIAIDDEQLDDVAGGTDAPQRSRVNSLTVTFTAQTTTSAGDPDQPLIVGSVYNADK